MRFAISDCSERYNGHVERVEPVPPLQGHVATGAKNEDQHDGEKRNKEFLSIFENSSDEGFPGDDTGEDIQFLMHMPLFAVELITENERLEGDRQGVPVDLAEKILLSVGHDCYKLLDVSTLW